MAGKPSLRTELLFHLTFLAVAALLVGVATVLAATAVAPDRTFPLVLVLVGLEAGVFVVYGGHLLRRLVLRPLGEVIAAADAVADTPSPSALSSVGPVAAHPVRAQSSATAATALARRLACISPQ